VNWFGFSMHAWLGCWLVLHTMMPFLGGCGGLRGGKWRIDCSFVLRFDLALVVRNGAALRVKYRRLCKGVAGHGTDDSAKNHGEKPFQHVHPLLAGSLETPAFPA